MWSISPRSRTSLNHETHFKVVSSRSSVPRQGPPCRTLSERSHSCWVAFRCPHLCRWRAQEQLDVRGYWSELDLMVSVPVRLTVT